MDTLSNKTVVNAHRIKKSCVLLILPPVGHIHVSLIIPFCSFFHLYNQFVTSNNMDTRYINTPEDFGAQAAWLVGPGAAYITGQVVAIDGGLSQCPL